MEKITKLRIVHFVLDDKFFYPVKAHFDNDARLENYYCLVDNKGGENLNYIKSQDAKCFATVKEAQTFVKSYDYDVLFFHSLPCKSWNIILSAPKDKKIIWWTWGYDVYTPSYNIPPFICIDLLLPKTERLFTHRIHPVLRLAKSFVERFQSIPYMIMRKRVLKRINYFMPVIHSEYQMMSQLPGTHASEFYYQDSIAAPTVCGLKRKADGHILFGNSATYTNNHLDIVPYLEQSHLNGRVIHLPLSYGVKDYTEELKKQFKVNGAVVDFMDKLLPRDEYFKFLDSCSYFICGCIRQQAMGNIYYCLNNHIKVFLFKDSLIYKYLKDAGYAVFEIESINADSFITPLTESEMLQNNEAYKKDYERRNSVYERCIRELLK